MAQLLRKTVLSALVAATGAASQGALACGGFFCDFVPIDQAGEQIVFRQEGNATTAMIKIDYVGNAEDFGWVLPVPTVPDISLGSDQIFTQLELATRPQFLLERKGVGCPVPVPEFADVSSSSSFAAFSSQASSTPAVTIERTLSVGPFDAQVISSDDPEALANWLDDNNLDLTDEGSTLLAPYVQASSKFVVLKLKNNANVGSIQPIILNYEATKPVIPMTLTAVAAQENMGALVWLLGNGRGVPVNFKHVTPNYSRLNWFSGTRNAYASYQNLITTAMDEAGGQGFATDFAGFLPNLPERFATTDRWKAMLIDEEGISDASFVTNFWRENLPAVQDAVRDSLPTSNQFIYNQPLVMEEQFTAEQLAAARAAVVTAVQEQVVKPIDNAVDILDDNIYLTRLYTTLSASEMTDNPEFSFNPMMDEQSLSRNATLTSACIDGMDHWTLELGAGTGREGEVVVDSLGLGSPSGAAVNANEQPAMWRAEKTSDFAAPIVVAQNDLKTVARVGDITVSTSSWSTSSSASSISSVDTTSSVSVSSETVAATSSQQAIDDGNTTNNTIGGSAGGTGLGLLALFGLALRRFKKH